MPFRRARVGPRRCRCTRSAIARFTRMFRIATSPRSMRILTCCERGRICSDFCGGLRVSRRTSRHRRIGDVTDRSEVCGERDRGCLTLLCVAGVVKDSQRSAIAAVVNARKIYFVAGVMVAVWTAPAFTNETLSGGTMWSSVVMPLTCVICLRSPPVTSLMEYTL